MRRSGARRRAARSAAALLLVAAAAGPLAAQQSTVPAEVAAELRRIGFSNPYERTTELYLPLLARAPKEGVSVQKDLAYGDHPRHRLDVYRPERPGAAASRPDADPDSRGAPVLVYVHGGGYTTGDRDLNEEVYGNVPTYFARHGLLGVNATYRLAPEAPWPAGAEDVVRIVAWVKANAAAHGGDPGRIFLMGHSAGATHVATYGLDRRFHPPEGHGLAGVILVSGRYAVKARPEDRSMGGVRAYFGEDPALYADRSPLTHVPGSDVPAMLVIAEFDQRNLVETTGELFAALCERDGGRCPRILQLLHHNHFSEVVHINTSDDLLGREVLRFVR